MHMKTPMQKKKGTGPTRAVESPLNKYASTNTNVLVMEVTQCMTGHIWHDIKTCACARVCVCGCKLTLQRAHQERGTAAPELLIPCLPNTHTHTHAHPCTHNPYIYIYIIYSDTCIPEVPRKYNACN